MTEIYQLEPNRYDPRFERFEFLEDAPSLLGNNHLYEDFGDGATRAKLSWEPSRLADVWVPQPVIGEVAPFVDYPCVSMEPAFSERAVHALRDLLEPNGELLPLKTEKGSYFAYNILTKSTAFDIEKSIADFDPAAGKETAYGVERFEFDPKELKHAIFRIREYPAMVLVTDEFKSRVEDAGLNGFYFDKVWPFPPGERWEDAERAHKREFKKNLGALNGQAFRVLLSIPNTEATEAEEKQGHVIAQELYKLLGSPQSLDGVFLGAIEGLETFEKELAISVVCPDVDRVYKLVGPWVSSIDWPNAVAIEKRYGNLFDENAKSVIENIK